MDDQQQAARTAQLWDLRHSDLVAVISLYRVAAGLSSNGTIPPGVEFGEMVRVIVEKEAAATVTLDCPNCEHKGPKDTLRRPLPAGTEARERLYYVCPKCKAEYPVPVAGGK